MVKKMTREEWICTVLERTTVVYGSINVNPSVFELLTEVFEQGCSVDRAVRDLCELEKFKENSNGN